MWRKWVRQKLLGHLINENRTDEETDILDTVGVHYLQKMAVLQHLNPKKKKHEPMGVALHPGS